jgi:thiamine-monophosphate kinase
MPSETELIQRYFVFEQGRADVIQGIGDDGAVVMPPAGQELVASVDTLVEGVHFLPGIEPGAIGHKALAVNLSDLAAMGAEPAWASLALTLPEVDEVWLRDFSRGLKALAQTYGVALIGGDLTRGPLSMTIQVLGFVPRGAALYRSGAQPGDRIFVTGSVGDAGLGLAVLQGRLELPSDAAAYLSSRLHRPAPRIEAALALRGCASAAIDVSDGLALDLERLLAASRVGATVELTQLPLSPAARAAFTTPIDWSQILTAGDDYELLFTVAPERAGAMEKAFDAIAGGATEIGHIEATPGLRCTLEGHAHARPRRAGYDHFAQP